MKSLIKEQKRPISKLKQFKGKVDCAEVWARDYASEDDGMEDLYRRLRNLSLLLSHLIENPLPRVSVRKSVD
jgi:hypothetical protein